VQGVRYIRLQAFLAKAGLCSRRKAEELIKQGKVRVNGWVNQTPFYKVDPDRDRVEVAGKRIGLTRKIYLLLNKPKGVTTTKKDPHAKRVLFAFLPQKYQHLHPVGRLDKDTRGLLLLTNDGELTFRLTHPKFGVEKTYLASLDKPVLPKDLDRLKRGVVLDDGPTLPCKVFARSMKEVEITIGQGRKRQVRRMFQSLGYEVVELTRIREGSLSLGDLAPGKFRILSDHEVQRLRSCPARRLRRKR
jgi:23S rRNA pseudouridine2605 synthase